MTCYFSFLWPPSEKRLVCYKNCVNYKCRKFKWAGLCRFELIRSKLNTKYTAVFYKFNQNLVKAQTQLDAYLVASVLNNHDVLSLCIVCVLPYDLII